jgi:hypothetical protein
MVAMTVALGGALSPRGPPLGNMPGSSVSGLTHSHGPSCLAGAGAVWAGRARVRNPMYAATSRRVSIRNRDMIDPPVFAMLYPSLSIRQ